MYDSGLTNLKMRCSRGSNIIPATVLAVGCCDVQVGPPGHRLAQSTGTKYSLYFNLPCGNFIIFVSYMGGVEIRYNA